MLEDEIPPHQSHPNFVAQSSGFDGFQLYGDNLEGMDTFVYLFLKLRRTLATFQQMGQNSTPPTRIFRYIWWILVIPGFKPKEAGERERKFGLFCRNPTAPGNFSAEISGYLPLFLGALGGLCKLR